MQGVVAAIITPVDPAGVPDAGRLADLACDLLENGCDGLNVLGTTGEATSFSRGERGALMSEVAKAGLPMHRLVVGTGAAATSDAVWLTRHAGELGFAGTLVLPPFYYKGVSGDGLLRYLDEIVEGSSIPLYLYNFPALSGIAWPPALVARLIAAFPGRIAGLKDSSGDMAYAREIAAIDPALRVFPSTEACLLEARAGDFAGCISATANVNADLCARAFHDGDGEALATAVAIRAMFDGQPLVAADKALVSRLRGDPA
ncbi:MAG: dihydrodipicolinate synthase family protein, partial [Flavobacteriaceae bacterium]